MRIWNSYRKALFLLCWILPCSIILQIFAEEPAVARGKSFLWEVRHEKNTVYILGSVHAMKKEAYPLPGGIEEAFERSDFLAVEADINEIDPGVIKTMLEEAFYTGEETLEKRLSIETYNLAKAKLAESGVPIELFQRNKPWVVALMIASIEIQKSGLNPEYGIDRHFLRKAQGRKKTVELESLDCQIKLFNSFTDADQELFLLYTLKDVERLKQEMDAVTEAWISGDTKTIESAVQKGLTEDPRLAPVYEKLFIERNRGMASRIEGFLKTGQRYFVVVGAGHLVGNEGIPELLKRRGYFVEQR